MRKFYLLLYYGVGYYLPDSYLCGWVGRLSNRFRIFCVKHIFAKCGSITTVNRKAYFGGGEHVQIGDYSGIGANSSLPSDIIIGNYVMLGSDLCVLSNNHIFSDKSRPMCQQGKTENKVTIIEDDCWIGTHVIMLPGRLLKKGSIVGAGAVVTKDFPEYSIIGGNPAKLIRQR